MRKNHEKIFFHIIYNVLVFCQWTYKSVDNGFDDPYRIAYTATNNGGNLKLESMAKFTGSPCDIQFYITGRYYCDDYPTVNVSFLINGVYQKFVIRGKKSPDNTTIFFGYIYRVQLAPTIDNPQNTGYVDFLPLFKAASSVKIRVNETHCESDYYEFNMASSTAAYNFMSQGCDEWNAKQKEAEKIKFIDLFCGIGGFRIAMDEAYIENDLIPEFFFHLTLILIAKIVTRQTLDIDQQVILQK